MLRQSATKHRGKRIFASDASEIDNDVMKYGQGKVPEQRW